jgi:hypothetical protein
MSGCSKPETPAGARRRAERVVLRVVDKAAVGEAGRQESPIWTEIREVGLLAGRGKSENTSATRATRERAANRERAEVFMFRVPLIRRST